MTSERDDRPLDVLIVGAGFSGVYLLHRLRERGFDVKVVDAAPGPGGIWYWNCYPGARVDSHVPNYEFSMEEIWRDWTWTERFPGWQELRRYFAHVVERLDLVRDIRYNVRITGGEFDEDAGVWRLECEDGSTLSARYFIAAMGFAARAYVPDIPGLGTFEGPCHHTAHWPQDDVEMTGKRVGVLGTGASGVQVIQEAGKVASHLTVFQRTPNMALPMRQRALTVEEQEELKVNYPEWFKLREASAGGLFDVNPDMRSALDVTEEERLARFEWAWAQGGFHFWAGTFIDILGNEEANRHAYAFWRDKVRERIDDPVVAEKLAPTQAPHPFGAKRPSLEQWYYDVFNQPNVELIDVREDPVEEITPTGVRTANGHHDLDVLVLATGFDSGTGGMTQLDIRGRSGQTIAERWKDGVDTYLGYCVPDYPNMLMLYGPHSPTAFWNGPSSAEAQGDWVVRCLCYLRDNGHTRIEATEEAAAGWSVHMDEIAEMTLLPQAESWYMGANIPGKRRQLLFHIGVPIYVGMCEQSAAGGYAGFELA